MQEMTSRAREETWQNIAAFLGSLFSPEGFAKVKQYIASREKPPERSGIVQGTEKQKTTPNPKRLRTTCYNCMRVFPYEEGENPVCPYCGKPQRGECPSCHTIFEIKSKDIKCPNCGEPLVFQEQSKEEQSVTHETSPEIESLPMGKGGAWI